ncbi:MAG: phosphate signaling complex protein PhoU [Phycisphaerales bacterium]
MPIDLIKELTKLRKAILTMGANVEQRVRDAVTSLIERDFETAQRVRRGDGEINAMEIDIEAECLRILALSHPVAGDLRFVLAVMRINANLERVGDLAKSIAKRALDLQEQGYYELPESLHTMASGAQQMLADALSALSNEDAEMARRVRRADDRIDDLQKEVFVWAQQEIASNVARIEAVIDILSTARKLERIGDQSTNIAEDVIFLSEGSMVRHTRA